MRPKVWDFSAVIKLLRNRCFLKIFILLHQLQAASSHLHLGTPKPRYVRVARAPREEGVPGAGAVRRAPAQSGARSPAAGDGAGGGRRPPRCSPSSPCHREEMPGSPPGPREPHSGVSGGGALALAVSPRRSGTAAGPPLPFALAPCL